MLYCIFLLNLLVLGGSALKHSKACYLTASILSVVLLFLLTPIQRYFSYLASTTYSIKWAWISLAEVAVMAVFFRSVPMLVPGALPEFPDSSGSGKGRSCPGGSGNGIFYYRAPSTVAVFCAALFLTGFSPTLPAGGHKQKKLRFVFVPWRSFFAPYDLL